MLTIAIQAGGESLRMGQDKALLPFLGTPMIARVIERLAPIADEMLVTTNHPDEYRFLGVPLFTDLIPGRGALGGLYTALSAASHPLVAVVACDMPFINPDLVAFQSDLLLQADADISIPRLDEGLEPLHAIYRRQSCLPHVSKALDSGKWRVDAWFEQVNVHEIPKYELLRADPQLLSFWNVNTPEDLQAAIQLAKGQANDQPGRR